MAETLIRNKQANVLSDRNAIIILILDCLSLNDDAMLLRKLIPSLNVCPFLVTAVPTVENCFLHQGELQALSYEGFAL
jgi:hypothetical protein